MFLFSFLFWFNLVAGRNYLVADIQVNGIWWSPLCFNLRNSYSFQCFWKFWKACVRFCVYVFAVTCSRQEIACSRHKLSYHCNNQDKSASLTVGTNSITLSAVYLLSSPLPSLWVSDALAGTVLSPVFHFYCWVGGIL